MHNDLHRLQLQLDSLQEQKSLPHDESSLNHLLNEIFLLKQHIIREYERRSLPLLQKVWDWTLTDSFLILQDQNGPQLHFHKLYDPTFSWYSLILHLLHINPTYDEIHLVYGIFGEARNIPLKEFNPYDFSLILLESYFLYLTPILKPDARNYSLDIIRHFKETGTIHDPSPYPDLLSNQITPLHLLPQIERSPINSKILTYFNKDHHSPLITEKILQDLFLRYFEIISSPPPPSPFST